jgi:hypothetical protein
MSDSLRTYHAVKDRVCQMLSGTDTYLTTNMSLMLTGLVRSRSVQQENIASEVPLRTQDRSFEKRQRARFADLETHGSVSLQCNADTPVLARRCKCGAGRGAPVLPGGRGGQVTAQGGDAAAGHERSGLPSHPQAGANHC